jgi:hypothetical protein
MSKSFTKKRVEKSLKVIPGFNVITVNLNFIPELIKVGFIDQKHHNPNILPDSLSWDLVITGSTSQLVISYDVMETRRLRYVASIPKVDPELTISF